MPRDFASFLLLRKKGKEDEAKQKDYIDEREFSVHFCAQKCAKMPKAEKNSDGKKGKKVLEEGVEPSCP